MTTVGKTIRVLRLAEGMKLSELARRSRISNPQLSLIESGERAPSMDALERIADALSIPASILVKCSLSDGSKLEFVEPHAENLFESVNDLLQAEERLRKVLERGKAPI